MHIEDGVPIPDFQYSRYPWKEMRVGQSFFVRTPDDQKVRARVLGSLTSCRCNAQRKLGRRFTIRRVPGGYRAWRVA